MARKKTSVPLFELMSRSREMVPERRKVAQDPKVELPESAEEGSSLGPPEEAQKRQIGPARPSAPAAPVKAAEPGEVTNPFVSPGEPIFQTGDGRIRLNLNYVSSVVVLAGLVLLLVGMFVLGRKTAGSLQGQYAAVAPRGDAKYLVLADIQGQTTQSKATLDKLEKYLYEQGVVAEVVPYGRPSKRYLLISYRGFEDENSESAQEYRQRVEELIGQAPVEGIKALPGPGGDDGPWWASP